MSSPLLKLQATVGKALSGVFFDATLTRLTTSWPAYDPMTSPTDYPCKALVTDYSSYSRANNLVGATDMKVLILASTLTVEPKPLDKIVITGIAFTGTIVANGTPGAPGVKTDPAKAVWECRCAT